MTWFPESLSRLFVAGLVASLLLVLPTLAAESLMFIDTLGIEVEPSENRQFSYSDNEAAY